MVKRPRIPAAVSAAFAASILAAVSAAAQTPIELHDNKYTVQQDVALGREAAEEVRREFPLLDDRTVEAFVERLGRRLVGEIPGHLRHPGFDYTFDVVNLKEINAFALPGGPMFLHRGMIEAARTDGEVAGVMAHELSHVILRHGTVQASKAQKFQLGALAGQILGSIVGGRTGAVIAQGSEFGLGTYFLKYSREYEREADLLGAQLMARAGYDPGEMASMFQTIQRQGGGRGPEWLSSHPDPGNRAEAIEREASMLRVDGRAPAHGIDAVHARLAQLSPAQSMSQVERSRGAGDASAGRAAVPPPSGRWRTYQPGDFLRLSVPDNWRPVQGGGVVTYAPDGAVVRTRGGGSGFTHGVQVGVLRTGGGTLRQKTDRLLQGFARQNPRLRLERGYSQTAMGGRRALTASLSNVSEATGAREAVSLSTVELADGSVLYLLGVAPADQARPYRNAFTRIRQSVRLTD